MRLFVAIVLGLLCCLSLSAQTDGDRVLVTAVRSPALANQFGGTVSTITAEDIARHQYKNLSDALKSVAGVYLSTSGGVGSQSSLFIRGAESDHVLVLIDGIEVTDPASSNTFRFEQFQLAGVERIEILRGTHSAQHGSEAMGGIINIVTQGVEDRPRMLAHIEGGSWDTYSGGLQLAARYQQFDFSVSASHFNSEGESHTSRDLKLNGRADNDGYENTDYKLNIGWALNQAFRLDGYYGRSDTPKSEYDSAIYDETDALVSFENDQCYNSRISDHSALKLAGEQGIWEGYWQLSKYRSQFKNHRCAPSYSRGERDKLEWHNDFQLNSFVRASIGAETEKERIKSSSAGKRQHARNYAIYTEASIVPSDGVILNASVRNDDPDDFDSQRSHRVSAVYISDDKRWRLHGGYGTGFKAPSLGDRFGSYGNPDLEVEKNDSWEVGLSTTVGAAMKIGGVYFANSIRDLIECDFSTGDCVLTNIGKASIEGVELFADTPLNDSMRLRADYTLLTARDDQHENLLRRPKQKATLTWTWEPHAMYSVSARVHYVGQKADLTRDTFARTKKGGYTLVHLTARRQLNDQIGLHVSVDNLLDKDYEPTDGYQGNGLGLRLGLNWQG